MEPGRMSCAGKAWSRPGLAARIMAEIGDSEAVQAIDPASVEMSHATVAPSRQA